MKKINYLKLTLDLLMAVTFVLLFNHRILGGLAFHEIAGLAIGVAFLTHMALNIRWIKGVTLKILDRKLPMKTRFEYLLNLVLLFSMAFIIVSGIFISRVVFPSVHIGDEQWFKATHVSVSFLALAIVGIHVGLHWKWVMNVIKKPFLKSANAPRPVGIALKLAMAAVLAIGVYEMNQTNFMNRLSSVTSAFGGSSSAFGDGDRGEGFRGDRGSFGGNAAGNAAADANAADGTDANADAQDAAAETNVSGEAGATDGANSAGSTADGSTADGSAAAPDSGDRMIRGRFEGRFEGGFKGGPGGEAGGGSAWNVLLTYLGIMGVFVIVVYYLSRLLSRKKSAKKKLAE